MQTNKSGVPDVANAAAVVISAEGGSVGRRVLASRHNESTIKSMDSSKDDENLKTKHNEILQFSNEHGLLWLIELYSNSLYVKLPQQLSEGSKEKFIDLLEFADEKLHCKNVIVYFDKTRSDRAALVKTFMFLGFHILSPNNALLSSIAKHSDQLSMVYIIDSDE